MIITQFYKMIPGCVTHIRCIPSDSVKPEEVTSNDVEFVNLRLAVDFKRKLHEADPKGFYILYQNHFDQERIKDNEKKQKSQSVPSS